MLYAMGVVLIGEKFKGEDLIKATTMYTVMWGAGAMAGPSLVGVAFDVFDEDVFPYTVSMFYFLFLVSSIFLGRNRNEYSGETFQHETHPVLTNRSEPC